MLNFNSYSQNINTKKWNSDNFDFVFLKLDFISHITINESISNSIYINYKQEGEFKENILLKVTHDNRELCIQEISSPMLKSYNDKLGVHKTVANTIDLLVPIDFKTIIKVNSCNINIKAPFSDINIEIEEGDIKSISANIFCVNPDIELLVSSKNGFVNGLYYSSIKPNLKVETIRGDITSECFIN